MFNFLAFLVLIPLQALAIFFSFIQPVLLLTVDTTANPSFKTSKVYLNENEIVICQVLCTLFRIDGKMFQKGATSRQLEAT